MEFSEKQFENFVYHPRYGRTPNLTDLNPDPKTDATVYLHWHSPRETRIPFTGIKANCSLQNSGIGYVTHYVDSIRDCVDCELQFIFYAKEQQYWYERLQFNLSANCIRCIECRKIERDEKMIKLKHDELVGLENRTEVQHLELAEHALYLFERCRFGNRTLELARNCLNSIPGDSKVRRCKRFLELSGRSKRLLDSI